MHHALRHDEALARPQVDAAILQVDEEAAADDVEELFMKLIAIRPSLSVSSCDGTVKPTTS